MTRILDLPTLGFDFTVGNNEDWDDSAPAYVDASSTPISFSGIAVVFAMRRAATDPLVIVSAATAGFASTLPMQGLIVVGGTGNNIWGIQVPRSVMLNIAPGSYVWEAQAVAEVTRTIGRGNVTVTQGIVR